MSKMVDKENLLVISYQGAQNNTVRLPAKQMNKQIKIKFPSDNQGSGSAG